MSKVSKFPRITLIILLALAVSGYASIIVQELLDDYYYYYSAPRILVDSSRDGGAWWFPQTSTVGGFDPDLDHQGKPLADYLRSQGLEVTELPRPFEITPELLEDYHLVVRPSAYPRDGYSPEEIAAYQQYVANGGMLVLLSWRIAPEHPDLLALGFGIDLQGEVTGLVDRFTEHFITSGIRFFSFVAGSVVAGDLPPYTTELGFIGPETAMGLSSYGLGQVFFLGTTYVIVSAQQPLTENVFKYFLTFEGLGSQVLQADLDEDAESGLLDKLEAAIKSHDDEKYRTMDNQMQAFINQVEALRLAGRLDNAVADQLIGATLNLMSTKQGFSEPDCPCWLPEDIAALPMKKTTPYCVSDGSRLDIFQEGGCENSFSVEIDSAGNLSCVANRFDCSGWPDLGGEVIETNEEEFLVCTNQIISRCEDLGIEPPEYP